MSNLNYIQKVAIVGATGRIGGAFVDEVLKTGKHTITAITRPDSKAALPTGVEVAKVDYDDEDSIVSALKGQQFLIITLGVNAPKDLQSRIIAAAGKAGVKYIMPNSYGSDLDNEKLCAENMYGHNGIEACKQIQAAGASSIVLVCGFWYQWSLALGETWFGFEIRDRKVTFFDDGKTIMNLSTWPQCGRAVAALLSLPESGASPSVSDWANKLLYIESFRASQRDMLDSIHRIKGTTDKDWDIKYTSTADRVQEGQEMLKAGDFRGFGKVLYGRSMFPSDSGKYDAKIANGVLGLNEENFDQATREAVEMAESGWNPFA